MNRLLENWQEYLPLGGVAVFALGSVHSLRYLLGTWARHDSDLLWLLAVAIETATAFLIWRIVEIIRTVTKSKQTKENRRFYGGLLIVLVILALPSLSSSVWANYVEFSNSVVLALLCPVMAVACAILSGIPHAERVFRAEKAVEKAEKDRKRAESRKAREITRKEVKIKEQEAVKWTQVMEDLGKGLEVLRELVENPRQSQAEMGKILGMSRKMVGYYLNKLAERGLISRNRRGHIEILVPRRYVISGDSLVANSPQVSEAQPRASTASPRTSEAMAGHLAAIMQAVAERRQRGEGDGTFRRNDVETWRGVSISRAKNILRYGQKHGLLEIVGSGSAGHIYRFVDS